MGGLVCAFCKETYASNEWCNCKESVDYRRLDLVKRTLENNHSIPKEFITTYPSDSFLTAGMLGTIVLNTDTAHDMLSKRVRMIEARILRIEEFIKRTGFNINDIDLSTVQG